MSDSELKLKMIRLIDKQNGETLNELYKLILSKIQKTDKDYNSPYAIEQGYKEMSEDDEREKNAFEWIESTG